MTGDALSDEEVRVLTALAASGMAGTGAESLAARTTLDKSVILDHLGSFWDRGLVEQVGGMRSLYRITDGGRDRLA